MVQAPQERRRASFFPPVSLFRPFVLSKSAEGRNDASADSAYPIAAHICNRNAHRLVVALAARIVRRIMLPSKRKARSSERNVIHTNAMDQCFWVFAQDWMGACKDAALHSHGQRLDRPTIKSHSCRPAAGCGGASRGFLPRGLSDACPRAPSCHHVPTAQGRHQTTLNNSGHSRVPKIRARKDRS